MVCSGNHCKGIYGLGTFGTPLSGELELITSGHNLTKEKTYVLVQICNLIVSLINSRVEAMPTLGVCPNMVYYVGLMMRFSYFCMKSWWYITYDVDCTPWLVINFMNKEGCLTLVDVASWTRWTTYPLCHFHVFASWCFDAISMHLCINVLSSYYLCTCDLVEKR